MKLPRAAARYMHLPLRAAPNEGSQPDKVEVVSSRAVRLAVPVAALGFEADCSLKPPPSVYVFKALASQLYKDGFVTVSEPLVVVQSRDPQMYYLNKTPWHSAAVPISAFSLGYVKGMARVTSLLAMLHCLHKRGVCIETGLPVLYKTVQVVYVLHPAQATKMDEAFQNMKLSARGSICKKTNIIQTVTMVQRLMNHGLSDAVAWFWLEPS